MLRNTETNYGLVAIVLHWLMAIMLPALFVLGLYMLSLDYYDPWYYTAPAWHKAVGVLCFVLLVIRWGWRVASKRPQWLAGYHRWEIWLARIVHLSFYYLVVLVSMTGYFMSTAKGASIELFWMIGLPSILRLENELVELMGQLHEIMAYLIMCLLLLHVAAAFKHHFIDKDDTLKRIIIPAKTKEKD